MTKRSLVFLISLALLLAVVIGAVVVTKAGSDRPARSGPHVFVLVLDELSLSTLLDRHGEVDGQRFPNLARLARKSTWYRNHTTTADATLAAVPSILNGQRPDEGKKSNYDNDHNLYRLLEDDYQIINDTPVEPISKLCEDCPKPEAKRYLAGARLDFSRGLQRYSGYFSNSLSQIQRHQKPTLWVGHLVMPHEPWEFLPDGRQYDGEPVELPGLMANNYWSKQWYPITLSQQRMILQTQFVDRVVGQFEAKIRKAGLWDDSLIIVVADHGLSFAPGRYRRSASASDFSETASVPLFVKYPGQKKGKISDLATDHTAILPTINRFTVNRSDYRGITLNQEPRRKPARTRSAITNRNQQMSIGDLIKERRQMVQSREQRISPRSVYLQRDMLPYLGRKVSPKARREWGSEIILDDKARFLQTSPGQRRLDRVYLTASTRGLRPGQVVLVTINGKVVAAGKVFIYGYRKHKFAVLINPNLLPQRGPVDLGFYLPDRNRAVAWR